MTICKITTVFPGDVYWITDSEIYRCRGVAGS